MSLALVSRKAALLAPWNRNTLWRLARAVPSLDLRFADNKSLVDATTGQNLVTFTRASSGTYVDSQGVIRTATTNLLLRSEEFGTTWGTLNSSVSADATIAPNGTSTADKIIENSTTNVHGVNRTLAPESLVNGIVYTFSVYAKAAERGFIWMQALNSFAKSYFNLSTGVISSSGSGHTSTITAVGNGWYRCAITFTSDQTNNSYRAIGIAQTSGTESYAGDGSSGLFLWGAQLEQSSTVGEYIPTTSTINSAPRFDHNPTTGESLGLLVEESRTNSLANNTMVGAAAGAPGTPPTGWTVTADANGISREIVGIGIEDGITYIDIKYSGTTTTSGQLSILPSTVTAITAASGQSWAASAYVKLQAGSLSGLTNTLLSVNGRSSVGAGLESTNTTFTPSNAALRLQRQVASIALANASTARVSMTAFAANYASGVTIDATLRIGLPQLEQGAFATSVIPTSTAAATRSADVASISGSNFSSWYRQDEGAVFAEALAPSVSTTIAGFSDGTTNERILMDAGTNTKRLTVTDNGVLQASVTRTYVYGAMTKSAAGLKLDSCQFADSGSLGVEDTAVTLPTVDRLNIGANATGALPLNGTIRRLTYWPQRLSNSTLQSITQ